jgi:predicted alpha/beta-fold hydrolase
MGSSGDFRPLPLLGNPHVQTILASLVNAPMMMPPTREHHVVLADGDRLMVHDSQPPRWRMSQPIVVLVHGLGGSHRSGYMRRLARLLWQRGYRVWRLDLRGCGRGLTLARRSYNAGCSADVRAVLAAAHRASPTSPLLLAGFSLGGNIVLKLAGEVRAEPVPGLSRVAAVAPPIDLERCSQLIAQPRNRLYELHYVRELVQLARQRQRRFPQQPAVRFPRRMTLWLFDELYTAPQGGFASALDYYRRSSAGPLIPAIEVPTLIVSARDDPFVAVESFEELTVPAHVDVRLVPRGGHLGFLGWDGAGGIRWAEQRLVEWLSYAQPRP